MAAATEDITAVIAEQHEAVKAQLVQVKQLTGQHRREAFHRLRLMLALHERAEERAVHPRAAKELGADSKLASDRVGEEQTAGEVIAELERLDVDSTEFASRFDELTTDVIAHAQAEENREWPALREIDDTAAVQAMARTMGAVTALLHDDSAPGPDATFAELLEWAETRLSDLGTTAGSSA